jgi:thiol-disulfide isomerase/thioredoxin
MRFYFLFFLLFTFKLQAQEAKIIHLKDLEYILNNDSQLTVLNFWATWCKPCVNELPVLLAAEKHNTICNFIFISLDFKRQLESLNLFLKKNQINSKVYLLDEPDYDKWINLVDTTWQGNIPATLIFKDGKKKFAPHELNSRELSDLINEFN